MARKPITLEDLPEEFIAHPRGRNLSDKTFASATCSRNRSIPEAIRRFYERTRLLSSLSSCSCRGTLTRYFPYVPGAKVVDLEEGGE